MIKNFYGRFKVDGKWLSWHLIQANNIEEAYEIFLKGSGFKKRETQIVTTKPKEYGRKNKGSH